MTLALRTRVEHVKRRKITCGFKKLSFEANGEKTNLVDVHACASYNVGEEQRKLYAENIAKQQELLDVLSPIQRADMFVKMARMIYRFDARGMDFGGGDGGS